MAEVPRRFFTSDTHFCHDRILKYCEKTRLFKNVDEMNEALVNNWNAKVKPHDEIFHVGDVIFAGSDMMKKYLPRLNGQKYLLKGNHDKADMLRPYFGWVKDYYELKIGKKQVVLMHYPIASWNREHYGSYHFHGHLHGLTHHEAGTPKKGRLDVGVDCWGMTPVSFEDAENFIKGRDQENG